MSDLLTPLLQLLGEGAVIGAHLVSVHSAPTYPTHVDLQGRVTESRAFENVNPGAYLRLPSGLTFGAYRNSYGRSSAYAGWSFQTADGRFALAVGGVTGYPGMAIAPAVVPSVRFDLSDLAGPGWAARLSVIPKPPREYAAAALHLSLEASL